MAHFHFFKGESKYCGLLAIYKNAPSSASAVDAVTNCNIAHKVTNTLFKLTGCAGLGFHPMKKCQPAVLCTFASDK